MMTEDEAKTKWCPMARVLMRPIEVVRDHKVAFSDCVSVNRQEDGYLPVGTACIGSKCMAWRKDHTAEFDQHGNLPGYCGAFGKVMP